MSADDFRHWYESRGLTQNRVADWLEVGERTVRRWAIEGAPHSVALLLRLMDRYGLAPRDV